ncbi:D-lactaldehyde dehydrogenase [Desarmillaria tabescens]|uniref:D-lactaldehyde dehydrogenase n=1 Tax=Armillaria tabescens TaxID=1929756 RepID=A0AA39JTA3_ARMTA|nr:D-lactaldehyde dehydrogenase [Desarmillaria tabescens]KAK0448418.1 D-lactaldehyde dehydrogenase [Desarmillaria tabescens]
MLISSQTFLPYYLFTFFPPVGAMFRTGLPERGTRHGRTRVLFYFSGYIILFSLFLTRVMPALQQHSNARILVTGVNGYIGSWIARTLLEQGATVKGTVRSEKKGKYIKQLFASYGDRFQLVEVPDIMADGAFDKAVLDVDGVIHTASPVVLAAVDPEEVIGPAVKGTLGLLTSVAKFGGQVQRVVVTSSCTAVFHFPSEPKVFSEADWNEQAVKEIEEKGSNASFAAKYCASKTLAEKAAWDFFDKHKTTLPWDLSVIIPPNVHGPFINEVANPQSLGYATNEWYNIVVCGSMSPEDMATQGHCWVDVRDLAEAHIRILFTEAAGGERIIVSAGPYVWQDWLDAANSLSPSPIPSHHLPMGVPGAGVGASYLMSYRTEKQATILGINFRTKAETARDVLTDFERLGW